MKIAPFFFSLSLCSNNESTGLVHEDCITKMRLMSLADLSSNDSGVISYAVIKDTLRVNFNCLSLYLSVSIHC